MLDAEITSGGIHAAIAAADAAAVRAIVQKEPAAMLQRGVDETSPLHLAGGSSSINAALTHDSNLNSECKTQTCRLSANQSPKLAE